MSETTINGVDYIDFHNKEAENRTKEIIDYLNTCKKNVMIVSPDAPFYITTGKQQPDTSVHQMD